MEPRKNAINKKVNVFRLKEIFKWNHIEDRPHINKHIEFYVGAYVSMYYVVQKDCVFNQLILKINR